MVIWTPEEWGRELDEFAAAAREKKFNKILYNDWKMMWSWRNLPSETDIYLKNRCNKNGGIMISPYGELECILCAEDEASWSFIKYLQSKYFTILGFAEHSTPYPITNLVQPHLTTDMPYTVNYASSPYSTLATSDVISNSNLTTITYDPNAVLVPGTIRQ